MAQTPTIQLTDLEHEVFALLPDIDDDTYVDDLVTLVENAKEPVHPGLLRIAAHRVGYFLDGGAEPEEDGASGDTSQRIVNAVKETAEAGESNKDNLLSAIARLQMEWFWGEMRTVASEVTYIRELISEIENDFHGVSVSEFVYWNILEPWAEFVGDGEFPDDEDYMQSFKEWKQAVEAFLGSFTAPQPTT